MFTNRCTWLLTSEVEVGGEREGKGGVMAEVGEGGREGGQVLARTDTWGRC